MNSYFRIYLSLFLAVILGRGYSQTTSDCFKWADSVLMNPDIRSAKKLYLQLTNLASQSGSKRSSIHLDFNRDVDFNYRHQRISLKLNLNGFKIDLLTRNDSVFVKTIQLEHGNVGIEELHKYYNTAIVTNCDYLSLRNSFYHSQKSEKELSIELSRNETYGTFCGMTGGGPDEYRQTKKLAAENQLHKLLAMLQSICVETQAYAVTGYSLIKNKSSIDTATQKLIDHIKARNSEITTCNGCIYGYIEKIYTKQ